VELFSLTLEGYRRFKAKAMLRTNGKLVALLGPNESGKSTIISALTHLNHSKPISNDEVSRGFNGDASIAGRFLLNREEAELANFTLPRWMIVSKSLDGQRLFSFEPPLPPRDISHRGDLVKRVQSVLSNAYFAEKLEAEEAGTVESISKSVSDLETLPTDLKQSKITLLRGYLQTFENVLGEEDSKPVKAAIATWNEAIEKESAPSPLNFAFEQLQSLVPDFLPFDDEARNLKSSYAIADIREELPPALGNLLDVAQVSLEELLQVVDSSSGADLTTLEHRANRDLRRRFSESWRQSGVTVAIRLSTSVLEVQVVNEATQFTPLAERSDGLRQFVALHAFALCSRATSPVLLLDEAEQRLHYNAQADLVQMLAKQQVAPKVIYTTHSAGCLPEDLGNGVRLVKECSDDPPWSEIKNKFWTEKGKGIQPLLIGMGASTLAFFPTRHAVLVEGPGDMLLYPSMFREITGTETLGFQFVHGLSNTAHVLAPLLPEQGANIAYLTDGDPGGERIVAHLKDAGVSDSQIVSVRSPDGQAEEMEDYLDPTILLFAANRLIGQFHSEADLIKIDELTPVRRMASLEAVYPRNTGVEVPKVELAYEILAVMDDNPGKAILDRTRKRTFGSIVRKVTRLFEKRT
jgi:energy-coupling factor transporter ATP-binding protein EcfA2